MRQFRLLAIACLMLSFSLAEAKNPVKNTVKKVDVFRPSIIDNHFQISEMKQFADAGYGQKEKSTKMHWDVLSDRSNNTTYLTPSNSKPYKSLDYLEKVRIAKIKDGYALVYDAPYVDTGFPQNTKDIEWLGWVPMSNLVLNTKSFYSEENLEIRALLTSDMVEEGTLYSAPSFESEKVRIDNVSQTFYYIISHRLNFYLLTTDPDVAADGSNILGWVPNDDVMLWLDWMAYEPSWDPFDVAYFSENESICSIKDEQDVELGKITFETDNVNTYNSDSYRSHSEQWRFPRINTQGDAYLVCAFPSDSPLLYEPTLSAPKANLSSGNSSEKEPINVFFVMDGSRANEPYFPIVAEKVNDMPYTLPNADVYVGALIYRDARMENEKFEFHQLSPCGEQSIFDFIDMGGEYGFKGNLSDAPVYEALNLAIDEAAFSPEAKNYIILFGGRGDIQEESATLPSDVISKFADRNVSLYAMQVQSFSGELAYSIFPFQFENLTSRIAVSRMEISDENSHVSISRTDNNELKSISLSSNGKPLFDGTSAIDNGQMSEEMFETLFNSLIDRIASLSGVDYSKSETILQYQLFDKVVFESKNGERDYFKEIVLYDEAYLDNLISLVQNLYSEKNRVLFLNKMEYVYNYTAYTKNSNSFENTGYYDAWRAIESVRSQKDRYSGIPLKSFKSEKELSYLEYKKILDELYAKYIRLMRIRHENSYRITIDGLTYYWVPVEDLP